MREPIVLSRWVILALPFTTAAFAATAGCGDTRDVVAVLGPAGSSGEGGASSLCARHCGEGCPCPATPMVAVKASTASYRIDSTEVTVTAYADWLETGSEPDSADRVCAFNESLLPGISSYEVDPYCADVTWEQQQSDEPGYPVTCVDWCDADAYCRWAGKRLCGRIDGGLLTPRAIPTSDAEWHFACSGPAQHAFPYGNTFNQSACNGAGSGNFQLPIDAGVLKTCEGGQSGLFDMSGNVSEWIDACYPSSDPTQQACARVGGAYYLSEPDSLSCSSVVFNARSYAGRSIGFRCCASSD